MNGILIQTFKGWNQHKVQLLAAAFTFYALLSLGPLLVLFLTVASYVLDNVTARSHVIAQLSFFVGQTSAIEIGKIIDGASGARHRLMATSIGSILLYIGASAVFNSLHEALNIIWEVPSGKRSSFFTFLRKQVIVVLMVIVIISLFLLSVLLSVFLASVSKEINQVIEIPVFVITMLDYSISVIIFSLLFMFIFRIVPDVKNSWKNVRVGAIVTSLVFNCGKIVMSRLLNHSDVLLAYGSLASFIVTVIWVYFSAQIVLLGAEFTRAYSLRKLGSSAKNTNDKYNRKYQKATNGAVHRR